MKNYHQLETQEYLLRKAAYEGDQQGVEAILKQKVNININETGKVHYFKASRFMPGFKLAKPESALIHALSRGLKVRDGIPYLNIALCRCRCNG